MNLKMDLPFLITASKEFLYLPLPALIVLPTAAYNLQYCVHSLTESLYLKNLRFIFMASFFRSI